MMNDILIEVEVPECVNKTVKAATTVLSFGCCLVVLSPVLVEIN